MRLLSYLAMPLPGIYPADPSPQKEQTLTLGSSLITFEEHKGGHISVTGGAIFKFLF